MMFLLKKNQHEEEGPISPTFSLNRQRIPHQGQPVLQVLVLSFSLLHQSPQ
jgi:hypothetical protein